MNKKIQEIFLKVLVDNKAPVAVYLRHGIKLTGKIVGFDQTAIFLEDLNKIIQIVLINAVSTVTPIFNP
jgi:RNA chaperone Hfq